MNLGILGGDPVVRRRRRNTHEEPLVVAYVICASVRKVQYIGRTNESFGR
jgi:hypothetical protein